MAKKNNSSFVKHEEINEKNQAIEAARLQIEKQFGNGLKKLMIYRYPN